MIFFKKNVKKMSKGEIIKFIITLPFLIPNAIYTWAVTRRMGKHGYTYNM